MIESRIIYAGNEMKSESIQCILLMKRVMTLRPTLIEINVATMLYISFVFRHYSLFESFLYLPWYKTGMVAS